MAQVNWRQSLRGPIIKVAVIVSFLELPYPSTFEIGAVILTEINRPLWPDVWSTGEPKPGDVESSTSNVLEQVWVIGGYWSRDHELTWNMHGHICSYQSARFWQVQNASFTLREKNGLLESGRTGGIIQKSRNSRSSS